MRKMVLVPLVFGVIFLIVGIVQSCQFPSLPIISISSSGTISVHSIGETQTQQTAPTTQLNIIGFPIILVSIGFITFAYLNNRKHRGYQTKAQRNEGS